MQQCSTMSLKLSCVHILTIVTQWRKSSKSTAFERTSSSCLHLQKQNNMKPYHSTNIDSSNMACNLSTIQKKWFVYNLETEHKSCIYVLKESFVIGCFTIRRRSYDKRGNTAAYGLSWCIIIWQSVCLTMNQILIVLHSTLAS